VVDSTSAGVSLSGTTVTYSGNLTGSSIQTIGVIDADTGNLLAQGRLADPVSDPSVDVEITVSNDSSTSKSVLTIKGQTLCAKILGGGNPDWPRVYVYGDGDSDPEETDTSIQSRVGLQDLDNQLLVDVSTAAEFAQIIEISDTDPLELTQDGSVNLLQSTYIPVTGDTRKNTGTLTTDSEATNGTAIRLDPDEEVEWGITTEYDIPTVESGTDGAFIAVRARADGPDPINLIPTFNSGFAGVGGTSGEFPPETYEWGFGRVNEAYEGDVIEAGDQNIGVISGSQTDTTTDSLFIDRVVLFDNRFDYNFDDNTVNADGALPGPELYPDGFLTELAVTSTQQTVSQADFSSSWLFDNVSNNQYVELSNDGTNYTRINNSATGSVTFDTAEFDINSRINFSRFGSRNSPTPTSGFQGQQLSEWRLLGNLESISRDEIGVLKVQTILSPDDGANQTFSEAGLVDSSGTLLTHSLIPEFTKQETQQVVSGERISFRND
jgi:hypothetical protein